MAQPQPRRNGHHERSALATERQLAEATTGHEMTGPNAPVYVLVILPAQNISLPEMLTHIEAGRIVLLIPAPSVADQDRLNPDIKAKPKQGRS